MIRLNHYIGRFGRIFQNEADESPWTIAANCAKVIMNMLPELGDEFQISNDVAIHKTALIDTGATLKGPLIISSECFIGAHAYLRGGVFLDQNVSIGPGCEVKSSFMFSHAALGHFNFVGNSFVGSHVNMEAGAVVANHYNERQDKDIFVYVNGARLATGLQKFGALIGDNCKIGANAVLSPGTILEPDTIVRRLALIDQSGSPR